MRIIGGELKGKQIIPPSGFNARPTTDFAKEGLFNTLSNQYDFDNMRVLDLFSGTGSISYEFASRGCKDIYSVEMSPLHYNFIRKTVKELNFIKSIRTLHQNVFDFLNICRIDFDFIFADPPYAIKGLDTLPEKIFNNQNNNNLSCLLKKGGIFILEHPDSYSFEDNPHFLKEKKYGNVHFSFFS